MQLQKNLCTQHNMQAIPVKFLDQITTDKRWHTSSENKCIFTSEKSLWAKS